MNRTLLFLFFIAFTMQTTAREKRDYLQKISTSNGFENCIMPKKEWVDFPTYSDREAWLNLPEKIRQEYTRRGEGYLDFNWPTIPASSYLDFARTGSRKVMEIPHNERKKAFESLVMAELMEGKGRFLDQIINGVWVYCEQTYWGQSAHLGLQEKGIGLPDVNDPTIDLGVGRIATNLAWAYHFFKEEFDKVNPLIAERLKKEITEKVLDPYYMREDFWWQGFDREFVNNWNPWCNYNVLNCVMLVEDDRDKQIEMVKKIMRSVDQFINYYHEDGGCEEGPTYWGHAGGKLFDVLELLYQISDGKIDIFHEELIKNIGRYISNAYISNPYFINFADAEARIHSRPGIIYRYGKRIEEPVLAGFGAFLAQKYHWGEAPFSGKIELALNNLFGLEEILNASPVEPLLKDFWLPETEIMGARDQKGSNQGFYFAAKGGYNAESHNHNDVGNFVLYYNGQPFLIDVGVGTYSRKTFSSRRYEIWNMQSGYHNLPKINGIDQKDGKAFKAAKCEFKSKGERVEFSLDIANAYPEEASVKSWRRSYILNRGKSFTIQDRYQLKTFKNESSLIFMTCCPPEVKDAGTILLNNGTDTLQMKYDEKQFSLEVEQVELADKRLLKAWGKPLYRIVLKGLSQNLEDRNKILVTPY